ncbi:MAG: hypothetical protein WBM65_05460 [Sedimenticolaceae bacterium]
MATKRKSTKKRDPNQITAAGKPNEDQAVPIARTVLRPTVRHLLVQCADAHSKVLRLLTPRNQACFAVKWSLVEPPPPLSPAMSQRLVYAQKRHSPDIVARVAGHVALTEVGPAATTLNCRSSGPRFIGWFQM